MTGDRSAVRRSRFVLRADHAAIEIAIPSSRDNDADSEISAVQFLPRDATQSAVMPQYVVYARLSVRLRSVHGVQI